MDSLGSILSGHKRFGRLVTHYQISKVWPELVGQTIADKTRVVGLKKKMLFVAVENSSWMAQLSFMHETIRQTLNEKLELQIEEIRFKVGTIKSDVNR